MNITISTTDFTLSNGQPDRIKVIHWRATETAGEDTASRYGTLGADLDAATTSEADCIAAVEAAYPDLATQLQEELNARSAPETGSGRVWEFPAGTPLWSAGVAYAVDEVVLWEGVPYRCIQGHTSQVGWFPPAVPALWSIQGQGPGEWIAGEEVSIGDERTYQGTTYRVIQAHTTQVGWEPPNVPALWEAV